MYTRRCFKYKENLVPFPMLINFCHRVCVICSDVFKLANYTIRAFTTSSVSRCYDVCKKCQTMLRNESLLNFFQTKELSFLKCLPDLKYNLRMFVTGKSGAKSFWNKKHRMENEPHARRSRISVNLDNILKIEEIIQASRRITII